MDPAAVELRSAEFLAVDVETNGLAGESCEVTEVGAVLVGGGELHDRFESLIAVQRPLSRGIQRFTGITQAMVDSAPPPRAVLERLSGLLSGRTLVAHNASFDRRALRQAFASAGLEWPDPPALCTLSLSRRFAPLARQRRLSALAGSLGIEVEVAHRALADAETCARVFCALFPRLCAHAATLGDALALCAPRRRRPRRASGRPAAPAAASRPDLTRLSKDPGVYVFRDADGRPVYVGKSVSVRARARAHLRGATEADWAGSAALVEHRPTESELGALVLENRLIKALQPPGNRRLKRVDGHVFLCCSLELDYPVLEVATAPPAGRGVAVGPLRGRNVARELVEQLNSLFGLRHCGRRLRRREHPSAYGQMGRCLSPCLGDLDPNLYRRRLDEALALFSADRDGAALLLEHVEGQMHAAAAAQCYERAAWLRRRHARLQALLERLGGVLRATHARPRLVLARHPEQERFDSLWVIGGRVADWGPLPALDELAQRTRAALDLAPRPGPVAVLAPDQVDEVRIVAAWVAAHDPPALDLDPAPSPERLAEFVAAAGGAPTATCRTRSSASPPAARATGVRGTSAGSARRSP